MTARCLYNSHANHSISDTMICSSETVNGTSGSTSRPMERSQRLLDTRLRVWHRPENSHSLFVSGDSIDGV